jgi:hypothetical protein
MGCAPPRCRVDAIRKGGDVAVQGKEQAGRLEGEKNARREFDLLTGQRVAMSRSKS